MIPNPFSWVRTIAIALGVSAAVGLIAYMKGTSDGREYERAQQLTQTTEDNARRGENNEAVRTLDECRATAELDGVSDEHCTP